MRVGYSFLHKKYPPNIKIISYVFKKTKLLTNLKKKIYI